MVALQVFREVPLTQEALHSLEGLNTLLSVLRLSMIMNLST